MFAELAKHILMRLAKRRIGLGDESPAYVSSRMLTSEFTVFDAAEGTVFLATGLPASKYFQL